MADFSVCMSVYRNDRPLDFVTAVHSIVRQTAPPDEIIIVVDGPVPGSIDDALYALSIEFDRIKIIRLKENMGHAIARQTGLDAASNNLCAVMDSDDISVPDRFEKQLRAFDEHPDVSVVGGLINEFVGSPDHVVGTRMVPENDAEIKKYLKARCPVNLVTVMLKRDDIQAAGGYQDWYCEEDYYLWVRLAMRNYQFYNIQENLVNVRVGDGMYRRRGGWKYFKSEAALQKYMWTNGMISLPRLAFNIFGRWVVQVLMPNKIRGFIFQKLFRKS